MEEFGCIALALMVIGVCYGIYRVARFALTDSD